jgi:hypothetical protein
MICEITFIMILGTRKWGQNMELSILGKSGKSVLNEIFVDQPLTKRKTFTQKKKKIHYTVVIKQQY